MPQFGHSFPVRTLIFTLCRFCLSQLIWDSLRHPLFWFTSLSSLLHFWFLVFDFWFDPDYDSCLPLGTFAHLPLVLDNCSFFILLLYCFGYYESLPPLVLTSAWKINYVLYTCPGLRLAPFPNVTGGEREERKKDLAAKRKKAVCPLQPGTGGDRGPLPTFLPQVPLNSKLILSKIHFAEHYIWSPKKLKIILEEEDSTVEVAAHFCLP